jgi:hypothetical protein
MSDGSAGDWATSDAAHVINATAVRVFFIGCRF